MGPSHASSPKSLGGAAFLCFFQITLSRFFPAEYKEPTPATPFPDNLHSLLLENGSEVFNRLQTFSESPEECDFLAFHFVQSFQEFNKLLSGFTTYRFG